MFDVFRLNPEDPNNRDGIHGAPVWIAAAAVLLLFELIRWMVRHPLAAAIISGCLIIAYCFGAFS
jgi:cytochrome c biogenesis protein CcdA